LTLLEPTHLFSDKCTILGLFLKTFFTHIALTSSFSSSSTAISDLSDGICFAKGGCILPYQCECQSSWFGKYCTHLIPLYLFFVVFTMMACQILVIFYYDEILCRNQIKLAIGTLRKWYRYRRFGSRYLCWGLVCCHKRVIEGESSGEGGSALSTYAATAKEFSHLLEGSEMDERHNIQ
jgi:hypothetical protein